MRNILMLLLLIPVTFWAQNAKSGGLYGKSETQIDAKDIKLESADRVYNQANDYSGPIAQNIQAIQFDFTYNPSINARNLKSTVAIYRLKISQEDLSKKGFVKLGAGNYGNTLFDAYYGSRANKKLAYAFNVNHLGALRGPVEKKNSSFSDNAVGAHVKYFLPTYMFYADANYRRIVSKNYGYRLQDAIQIGDTAFVRKNPTNDIFFDLGLKSIDVKSKFKTDLNIKPYYFSLNDSLNEFLISNILTPSYEIDFGKIRVPIQYDFSSLNSNTKLTRSFFGVQPTVDHLSDDHKLLVEGGLTFHYSTDTTLDKKLAVYPFLKGSYLLSENKNVMLKAQLSGGLEQQNLKSTYSQNWWLGSFSPNTENNKIKLQTSLEAQLIKRLFTKIHVDYRLIDNFNFYRLSDSLEGYYGNQMAKEPVTLFNPGLEVGYEFLGGHGVKAALDILSYGSEDELSYLPNFKSNIEFYAKIKNKLKLSTDFSYISGIVGEKSVKFDPIIDWNIRGNYDFNQRFGAFLYANNLLNQKYRFVEGYPVQGINIIGGLTISF